MLQLTKVQCLNEHFIKKKVWISHNTNKNHWRKHQWNVPCQIQKAKKLDVLRMLHSSLLQDIEWKEKKGVKRQREDICSCRVRASRWITLTYAAWTSTVTSHASGYSCSKFKRGIQGSRSWRKRLELHRTDYIINCKMLFSQWWFA